MMRLEYVGGTSRKHWHGEQIGVWLVFRWGRIGLAERKLVRRFASTEQAARELQRRQRAKLRKGYAWRLRAWEQQALPF